MGFWSSQTLEARVVKENLIHPFRPRAIDCNAYTLRIGPEYYVTPTVDESPSTHTKRQLSDGEGFTVPAGQFAFIITEEQVHIPTNAMAFISIKAKIKFRGLVNVSGFHVDPGWKGPLIFAVFNAGPATVHLHRGQDLFLIWYADLDKASERHKNDMGGSVIPPDIINNISGELYSLQNLSKTMHEKDEELSNRIHDIEKTHVRITTILSIVATLLVGLAAWTFRGSIADLISHKPDTQTSTATPGK